MNKDSSEYYAYKVLDDLESFLSKDKQAVSAVKVAGILGLSNMNAYAVKARVEHQIAQIIPEVEKEEGVKIQSLGEYAEWSSKMDREARTRKEAAQQDPVKEPVKA